MPSEIWIIGIGFVVALILWFIFAARGTHRTGYSPPGLPRHTPPNSRITDEDELFRLAVPERFVVFDLETTGLNPAQHEIIEIAAIKVSRDSDVHDYFQSLVKPLKRIPKGATQKNGITDDMVNKDGEPLETVLREFTEFIADLPLVSFNADFDMGFLERSAKRRGLVIRNRVSCALKMARSAWPGRESYRLGDLAKDGNLSLEDMHRALGDCKRTIFVYTAAAMKLTAKRDRRRTGIRG